MRRWILLCGFWCVFGVSGCDNPFSTGVSSEEGNSNSQGGRLANEKTLSTSRDALMTSTTPVLPLINEALRELSPNRDVDLIRAHCDIGIHDIDRNLFEKEVPKNLLGEIPKNPSFDAPLSILFYGSKNQNLAVCAASEVLGHSNSVSGWPVPALRDSPKLRDFMKNSLAASIVNAEILSDIAESVTREPGKSKEFYKQEIKGSFIDQSERYLSLLREEMAKDRGFNRDLTGSGPAPVHFISSDGYDFQQGAGGVLLSYNGIEWFGKGWLKGTRHMLEVARSRKATLVTGETNKSSLEVQNVEGSVGNVSVH